MPGAAAAAASFSLGRVLRAFSAGRAGCADDCADDGGTNSGTASKTTLGMVPRAVSASTDCLEGSRSADSRATHTGQRNSGSPSSTWTPRWDRQRRWNTQMHPSQHSTSVSQFSPWPWQKKHCPIEPSPPIPSMGSSSISACA